MTSFVYLVPALGALALLYTFVRSAWVTRQDPGSETMREIAGHISNGARAFLFAEYRVLAIFAVIAGIGLAYLGATSENSSPLIVVSFLIGALFSVCAGFIGMTVATKANVRTANAAR
ncbi:MAG TPA: sodium/proton-translocating pyrophosphatase, partial [Longimicrobiaceae bacterium]